VKQLLRLLAAVGAVIVLTYSSSAYAAWSGYVRVQSIATDVYPSQGVVFKVDGGPCPGATGAWMYYRYGAPADANLKATYAAVLAAYLSGRSIWMYVTTGCSVTAVRPS
jgi:hypothetical protein